MDIRFKTPANFYVCGPTQCGKSHLVRSLLHAAGELFYPTPSKIIYCYGEHQKEFNQLPAHVTLVRGLPPNLYNMLEGIDNSLIVLDDLMMDCSNDRQVADLFTRGSHHRGISVMYLTQNMFPPGKLSRTINLNCHHVIMFRNPRDSLGMSTLAKQMYPRQTGYLMDAYQDATAKPYGYLWIDCHPLTPDEIRLRACVLPGEKPLVYVKRT